MFICLIIRFLLDYPLIISEILGGYDVVVSNVHDPRIRYLVQPGSYVQQASVAPTVVQHGHDNVAAIDNLDGIPLMDEDGQYVHLGEGKFMSSVGSIVLYQIRQFANSPIRHF